MSLNIPNIAEMAVRIEKLAPLVSLATTPVMVSSIQVVANAFSVLKSSSQDVPGKEGARILGLLETAQDKGARFLEEMTAAVKGLGAVTSRGTPSEIGAQAVQNNVDKSNTSRPR